MHWAQLLGGAELAYLDKANKDNVLAQQAALTPIPGCKRYDRRMPMYARKYLAALGNITNSEVLCVTVIEIWCASKEVMDGFQRCKNAMKWVVDKNITQAELNQRCFEYSKVLYPDGRWSSFRSLEVCASAFRRAKQTKVQLPKDGETFDICDGDLQGQSLWDEFSKYAQDKFDFQKVSAARYDEIFLSFYEIFITLRSVAPHYITRTASLLFPHVDGFVAKCSILPEGIPCEPVFSRVSADMARNLIQSMKGAEAVRAIAAGEDIEGIERGREKAEAEAQTKWHKRRSKKRSESQKQKPQAKPRKA